MRTANGTPRAEEARTPNERAGGVAQLLRRHRQAALAILVLTCLIGTVLALYASERYEANAAIAGLLLALVAALVFDRLDRRLRDPADIEAALGVPVLGVLPAPTRESASARAGPCANLVARLELQAATPSSLLMVAACGRRGATGQVAAGLARQFAELDRRVLLIQADLRCDSPGEAIPAPGLTTLLSGEGTLSGTVGQLHIVPEELRNDRARPEGVVSYSVLSTGPTVTNPGALLEQPALGRLLKHARTPYDIVVIDSGGVLPVSDTAPWARLCDSILLVAERARTSRSDVKEARRVLGGLYEKVVGITVQKAPRRVPARGHPRVQGMAALPSAEPRAGVEDGASSWTRAKW